MTYFQLLNPHYTLRYTHPRKGQVLIQPYLDPEHENERGGESQPKEQQDEGTN